MNIIILAEYIHIYFVKLPNATQLGLGNLQHTLAPQEVRVSPTNEEAKDISCGAYHTAVLTVSGHLYTWGSKEAFSPLPHKLPTGMKSQGRISSSKPQEIHMKLLPR